MEHRLRNEKKATDVSQLRGGIVAIAKQQATRRFTAEPSVDQPKMWITDNETGNTTCVSLFAAGATLAALAELFPEKK